MQWGVGRVLVVLLTIIMVGSVYVPFTDSNESSCTVDIITTIDRPFIVLGTTDSTTVLVTLSGLNNFVNESDSISLSPFANFSDGITSISIAGNEEIGDLTFDPEAADDDVTNSGDAVDDGKVSAILTIETDGAEAGDEVIFFDSFASLTGAGQVGDCAQSFFDIGVTIVNSTEEIVKVNPPGAKPGSTVTVDGLNLATSQTMAFTLEGPSYNETLTLDSCDIDGGTDGDTNGSGRIQCDLKIPSSGISTYGTYEVCLAGGSTDQCGDVEILNPSSSGGFVLNPAPPVIHVPAPDDQTAFTTSGSSVGITMSFTPYEGFTDDVTFTFLGLPPGMQIGADTDNDFVFNDTQLTAANGQGTGGLAWIEFVPSLETPAGVYGVSVLGVGDNADSFENKRDLTLIVPPTADSAFAGSMGVSPTFGFELQEKEIQIQGFIDLTIDDEAHDIVFTYDGASLTTSPSNVLINSSSGQFSATFVVPDTFDGYHLIQGTVRDSDDNPTADETKLFAEFLSLPSSSTFHSSISPDDGLTITSGQTAGSDTTLDIVVSSLKSSFAGETLDVNLYGVPFGVDLSFNGVSDSDHSTTLTLPAGKSSKKLTIELDPSNNPYPGYYFLWIDVCNSGATECSFLNAELYVDPPSTFGNVPTLSVTPTFAKANEPVTLKVNNFIASGTVTVDFGDETDVFVATNSNGLGSKNIPIPATMTAGKYFVSASDSSSNNDSVFFEVLDSSDTFGVSVSPQTIDNLQQSSTGTSLFLVEAFLGNDLDCDGGGSDTVSIAMSTLPPGLTAQFDDGAFSNSPSTTLTVTPGAQIGIPIHFNTSSNILPGFYDAHVEATCDTEVHETFVEIGVIPDTGVTFGSFDPYDFGDVKITPNVLSSGSQAKVSGCCWEPGDDVDVSIFTGSATNTAVTILGSPTFNSSGAIPPGTTITMPTISEGYYELDVVDESGGFGTVPFTVTPAGQTFILNAQPQFIDSIKQGGASENVTLEVEALPQQDPGATAISVNGLPQGMTATIDGTDVTTPGTSESVTPEKGESVSATLVLTPSTSTPPGLYIIQLTATAGAATDFAEVVVPVELGGALSSIADQFATLAVNPAAVQEGKIVKFIGTGFNANEDLTMFILDEEIDIGTFSSDSDGDFSFKQQVPDDTSPGIYPVTIFDESGLEATANLEVYATDTKFILSASPDFLPSLRQGETSQGVIVSLSSPLGVNAPNTRIEVEGLPPGIDLRFDDNDVDSVTLDPILGGKKTTIIKFIPSFSTPPGAYDVIITAEEVGGTAYSGVPVSLFISPDVDGDELTSVMMNPLDVLPGHPFTLVGEGFVSGTTFSTLEIKVSGDPSPTTITLPTTVTVDGSGDWIMMGVIPKTIDGQSTDPGTYIMSITAGEDTANEKTGSLEFNIIPSNTASFKVKTSSNTLSIDQGVALGSSTSTLDMKIKPSMSFSENLTLDVSDLPPGVQLQMDDSQGNTLATFTGTSTGVSQTAIPTLTINSDIFPGKLTPLELTVSANDKVPVGVYEIFVGAFGTTLDLRGVPITLEVLDSLSDPSVTVTPSSGSALDSGISLIGSNFANSETLTVTFGGEDVGDNEFSIDPNPASSRAAGTFALKFTVPNLSSGIYPIIVTDETGNTAFTNFQIIPSTADSIAMQIAPKKVLIEQGANNTGKQTITVKTLGSFTESITLSASGLPSGITASFSPSTFTPTPGTSTPIKLTLTDDGTAAQIAKKFTVTATSANDVVSEVATVEVIPTSTFIFSVGPDEIILQKGVGNATVKTQVTAIGSPTNPAVTVDVPSGSGISASSITTPLTIDSSSKLGTGIITFSADNTASLGVTTVTINAGTKSATLDITVTDTTITNVDNKEFDPSSISEKIPLKVTPKFTGFSPTLTFESITTDTQSNTQILTNKFSKDPVDLAAFPSNILSGDSNILTIDVEAGVSEIEVDICLPVSDTIEETQTLMFLNAATDEWESVTSNIIGSLICVDDVDHTSSWAVGGVKALASGGAGGFAPTFSGKYFDDSDAAPLEINGIKYDLPQFKNKVDKRTISPGEQIEFKFTIFENSGGENLEHFEFLTNLTGKFREYHNSDTFIIYEKGEELIINDPHEFFANVEFDIDSANFYEGIITIKLTFAKQMGESDVYIRTWDSQRFSEDTIIQNAIEVIGEEIDLEPDVVNDEPTIDEISVDPEPGVDNLIQVPQWIKNNAEWWNNGRIADETFVQSIEFLIHEEIIDLPTKANVSINPDDINTNIRFQPDEEESIKEIPPWIKNTAGWWSEGMLSDMEFVNAIEFLVKNQVIKV